MKNVFSKTSQTDKRFRTWAAKFGKAFPLTLMLMITLTTIVFAAYTGPNRSTYVSDIDTFWERKHCHYEAWYDPAGTGYWGCHYDTYVAPSSGCPGFSNWTNASCGWPAEAHVDGTSSSSSIESCSSGQAGCTSRTEDNSYWNVLSPATVSGTNACTTSGSNGWCRGGATIALSGSDPISPWIVTAIEGSLNGGAAQTLCSTSSCTWTYPEGANILNIWSMSSHGDTSYQTTRLMNLDTVPPSSAVTFSGSEENGWFNDAMTIVAVGTDATSTVATEQLSVDGGTLQASPIDFTQEGTFDVYAVVTDVAGWQTTSLTRTFSRDVTPPTATVSLNQTPLAGWYSQPLTVSASGIDNLSGYDRTEYTLTDGAGVVTTGNLPVTLNVDGLNTIDFTHFDVAGNPVTASASYNLDLTHPVATINSDGTFLTVTLSGVVTDNATGLDSGISTAELSIDGGASWTPLTIGAGGSWSQSFDTTAFPDGGKTLQVRATDVAGNQTVTPLVVNIGNAPASVYVSDPWTLPASGSLEITEGIIGYSSVSVSICDSTGRLSCIQRSYAPDAVPATIEWDGTVDGVEAPAGDYDVTVVIYDNLGRRPTAQSAIIVPLIAPRSAAPTVAPLSAPAVKDEGSLISFFGIVDSFDDVILTVDGKSYNVADDTSIDATNGDIVRGALVSGTAMSLSNRLVTVRSLAIATGDGLVTFQGVISFMSEPDADGNFWIVIDDLAYKITPATEITGEIGEGIYVVGMMRDGVVVQMWVVESGSADSLVQFQGTVSDIVGSVDTLPYTLTVEGLSYRITDDSVISGDPVAVGVYVTGTAMGIDRSVLGMQVTSKKPGLWSLALDFFNTTLGTIIIICVALIMIIFILLFLFLKRRKKKKDEELAVEEAVEKLSN